MQTQPGYPSQMRQAISKLLKEEGVSGFYKSLVPLWARQIPYTMMKFASFERTVELLYKSVINFLCKWLSYAETYFKANDFTLGMW